MEGSIPLAENLAARRVNLSELVDIDSLLAEGVSLYQVSILDLYSFLRRVYQEGSVSSLDNSVASCSGGAFRSSRLNQELFLMGVKTALAFSPDKGNKGIDILRLEDLIKTSEVTVDGYLKLDRFDRSLETLFMFVDPDSEEVINLVMISKLIKDRQRSLTRNIKLDIVVIPEDEDQVREAGMEFEKTVLKSSQ